ncbi:MAG: hypothetical protein SWY16_15720 [Cyanobacteriota bacterium]|nr:hypothetical protein [Cyanobacteriota bacterium]
MAIVDWRSVVGNRQNRAFVPLSFDSRATESGVRESSTAEVSISNPIESP